MGHLVLGCSQPFISFRNSYERIRKNDEFKWAGFLLFWLSLSLLIVSIAVAKFQGIHSALLVFIASGGTIISAALLCMAVGLSMSDCLLELLMRVELSLTGLVQFG